MNTSKISNSSDGPILKPCPFCGKPPRIFSYGGIHSVTCDNIDCIAHVTVNANENDPEINFAIWNNRPAETSEVDFNTYQLAAARTSRPDYILRERLSMAALGAAGESGEFADLIKKWLFHGHNLDTNKITAELGDILWYLAEACSALHISLADVAQANIDKLKQRYPDGFSTEKSINRKSEP